MKRDLKNPLASTFGDDPTSKKPSVKTKVASNKLDVNFRSLGDPSRLVATKNEKYPKSPKYPKVEGDLRKQMDPDRVKKTIADIDEMKKNKELTSRDATLMKKQLLGDRGLQKYNQPTIKERIKGAFSGGKKRGKVRYWIGGNSASPWISWRSANIWGGTKGTQEPKKKRK